MRPFLFLYILAILSVFGSSSCSFDYGTADSKEDMMPEMVLESMTADRYENALLSVAFSAQTLEMYRTDRIWAAEEISFVQYAAGGTMEIEARGSAGLLLVDDAHEIYTLGDGVSFELLEDNLFVSANDLRWSKKDRTLSGSRTGEVVISKDDGTLVRGIGFFADTASRTYDFAENVSGMLVPGDADADADAIDADDADAIDAVATGEAADAEPPAGLQ